MPCPQTVYAAVLKSPRETIEFQMPSGSSEPFEIWLDNVSNVELIKCDLCGQFVPLQISGQTKRSTSQMKRHRDSKVCQKLMKKNKLLIEPVSFTFVQEQPQSQINSGSLSHGQANFYCSIDVQMLILFLYLEGLVFAGPVHWTENMTKTELNPTAKDRTTSCSCPQLGSVQLPVAMFSEIFKNRKRPVFCHATCRT